MWRTEEVKGLGLKECTCRKSGTSSDDYYCILFCGFRSYATAATSTAVITSAAMLILDDYRPGFWRHVALAGAAEASTGGMGSAGLEGPNSLTAIIPSDKSL